MAGAFQTSREIFENPIWQDVIKFRIFFFIVGNAVFAEEGVTIQNIHVGRGQFLRSYRNLISDLEYLDNRTIKKYSISVISKKIDQLVKEERLKIESTELGTLFTVVNYAEYQGFERYKKDSENGTRTEREQNENGTRTEREQNENNNNNVNKDKNVKKDVKKDIIPKINFAEFVKLTQNEYDKLVEAHGEDRTKRMIEILDNYKGANNKKYASDYRAILNWVVTRVGEEEKGGRKQIESFGRRQTTTNQYNANNSQSTNSAGQQVADFGDDSGNGKTAQGNGANASPSKYNEFVRK